MMVQFTVTVTAQICFLILGVLIRVGVTQPTTVPSVTVPSINTNTTHPDICEQDSNLNFIKEQTDKYKSCMTSAEVKLFPFNCTQYKTIVNCFHDYTSNVQPCFKEIRGNWDITNKILTDSSDYLCDPKNELLHTFYLHGGRSCLTAGELAECGPSMINVLLNNTQYHTFSKELLAHNYSLDLCSEEEANAQCTLHGISLHCKETPNITLIADNLHQIVMKHSSCSPNSAVAFDIRVNFNLLIMVLFFTVMFTSFN